MDSALDGINGEDGSYTGVFGNNVLNVKQESNRVIFKGNVDGDIKTVCKQYFDLNRDYDKIKNELSNVDEYLKKSINYVYTYTNIRTSLRDGRRRGNITRQRRVRRSTNYTLFTI